MYCSKCGSALREGATFCTHCGQPVETETVPATSACAASASAVPRPPRKKGKRYKRKRRILWCLVAIATVLVLTAGTLLFLQFRNKSQVDEEVRKVQQLVDKGLAPYLGGDGELPEENYQKALRAVARAAEKEIGGGTITLVEKNPSCVLIETVTGGSIVLMLPEPQNDPQPESPAVEPPAVEPPATEPPAVEPTQEPLPTEAPTVVPTVLPGVKDPDIAQRCLSLQPFFGEASASHPDICTYPDEAAQVISDRLIYYLYVNDGTAEDDNRDDEEVTVELLKELSDYAVVIFQGRGGYSEQYGSFLATSLPYTDAYEEDLLAHRILISTDGYMLVTAAFFDAYLDENENMNAVIYLGACESGTDERLAESFLNKGFKCVIANSDTILRTYNLRMEKTFFEGMSGQTGSFLTAGDALAYAKAIWGEYDPYLHATPLLFGDETTVLIQPAAPDPEITPESAPEATPEATPETTPEPDAPVSEATPKPVPVTPSVAPIPEDYTYQTVDGYAVITGYTGGGGHIAIPSELGGCPVRVIGESVFEECGGIVSVYVPDSVTEICSRAFMQCFDLESVRLPQGLETIRTDTFGLCRSMWSISIPENVTTLESYALASYNMTQAIFRGAPPVNVGLNDPFGTEYGPSTVFEQNLRRVTLYYPAEYAHLWAPNGETEWNGYPICPYSGTSPVPPLVIPYVFTTDGGEATVTGYTGTEKEIAIPFALGGCRVTGIGYGAFAENPYLEQVYFTDRITWIAGRAFYGCTSLKSVALPYDIDVIEEGAFGNCTALKDLYLPDGLIEITESAFQGCTALTNVEIPFGTEIICGYAFAGCSSLASVQFFGLPPEFGLYPDDAPQPQSVFEGCAEGLTLFYPEDYASFYCPNDETEWYGYPIRQRD